MAEYQSEYTGPQIDAAIAKANTATQPEDLGDLASKDTVNYETEVTNKPTIPAEVTEQTVAGWGFTKNTGDYTKPADGIPATDLTQAVQAILEKANAINLSTYEFNETDLGPTVLAYIATNNPDVLKVTTQQGAVQDYYKGQDREYYCYINGYYIVLTITGSEGSYNLDVKSYDFEDFSKVNGTDDGTNWTSITINGTTKNIPAGGAPQLIATKTIDTSVDTYAPTIGFPTITTIEPGHYYFVTSVDNWGAQGNILEGVMEFTVFTGTSSPATTDKRNAHFGSGSCVYWQDGSSPSPTGNQYASGLLGMMDMDYDPQNNFCMNVNFDDAWSGVEFSDGAVIKVYYKPL